MTRVIRTLLDAKFEQVLRKARDELFKINQEAVKTKQNDVKGSSCYIIEIMDGFIENMEEGKKEARK